MEKLTETINAVKISKRAKEKLIQIAEYEHLQIQQVIRIILYKQLEDYYNKDITDVNKMLKL